MSPILTKSVAVSMSTGKKNINVGMSANNNGLSVGMNLPRGSGGTTDYEALRNKPSIESVTLIGNKDFPDLGLSEISADDLLEILT